MTQDRDGGLDRRQTLKCMLWAGTELPLGAENARAGWRRRAV